MRAMLVDLGDLPREHVEIDVGRGQHHILDLRREALVADRHLAQRLQRHPIAHGMREDRDLADRRVLGQRAQHCLQRVARIARALMVVAIVEQLAARGPGEQHRQRLRAGIMDDLREAIDRLGEQRVEAVDEDQRLPLRRLGDARVEGGASPPRASSGSARSVTNSRAGSPGRALPAIAPRRSGAPHPAGWRWRYRRRRAPAPRSPVKRSPGSAPSRAARRGDEHFDAARARRLAAAGSARHAAVRRRRRA